MEVLGLLIVALGLALLAGSLFSIALGLSVLKGFFLALGLMVVLTAVK